MQRPIPPPPTPHPHIRTHANGPVQRPSRAQCRRRSTASPFPPWPWPHLSASLCARLKRMSTSSPATGFSGTVSIIQFSRSATTCSDAQPHARAQASKQSQRQARALSSAPLLLLEGLAAWPACAFAKEGHGSAASPPAQTAQRVRACMWAVHAEGAHRAQVLAGHLHLGLGRGARLGLGGLGQRQLVRLGLGLGGLGGLG